MKPGVKISWFFLCVACLALPSLLGAGENELSSNEQGYLASQMKPFDISWTTIPKDFHPHDVKLLRDKLEENFKPKDEFETTNAFDARIEKAMSEFHFGKLGISSTFACVVSEKKMQYEFMFRYDADSQKAMFNPYGWCNTDYSYRLNKKTGLKFYDIPLDTDMELLAAFPQELDYLTNVGVPIPVEKARAAKNCLGMLVTFQLDGETGRRNDKTANPFVLDHHLWVKNVVFWFYNTETREFFCKIPLNSLQKPDRYQAFAPQPTPTVVEYKSGSSREFHDFVIAGQTLSARFLKEEDGTVSLEKKDGDIIRIELKTLADAEQAPLLKLMKKHVERTWVIDGEKLRGTYEYLDTGRGGARIVLHLVKDNSEIQVLPGQLSKADIIFLQNIKVLKKPAKSEKPEKNTKSRTRKR